MREKDTDRQTDRQIGRERDRETERQRDRETERQRGVLFSNKHVRVVWERMRGRERKNE